MTMRTWITVLKRSLQSFGSDKCATLAAAIAYYTVFALFPMALIGVSILGFFVSDGAARQQVVNSLASVISLGDASRQALSQTLAGVSRARGLLGLVGLLTALWGASGLFGSIRSALDSVWDVDRPLPVLRAKARDLLLFVAFGGLLMASTVSTGLLQSINQIGPLRPLAGPVGDLLGILAPLLFTFAAFMVLYRLAPHARLEWRDIWPAAAITTIAFDFGKNLLTLYLRHVASLNVLAGSLGAAILFLAFVYYASQVILLAAEFAKHLMLVKAGAVPATDTPRKAIQVPLAEKLKGTAIRLWQVGHPHHDEDLPYAPARMDVTTNRPTNTREEVLFKLQEAEANAARDSEAAPGDHHGNGVGVPPREPVASAGRGPWTNDGQRH
jgi:membrane protein